MQYVTYSFPGVCFFSTSMEKTGKSVCLRILFPNMFVLFVSDTILVVYFSCGFFFSFRGASPFNFHYAFSRSWSYNHTIFILFLLWIFLRNGKTILSIEGTFGERYNWELKSKTNNWLEMHERKWRLLSSLNHFLSYMSAAEIRQLDMDFLFAFMCFMWK